MCIRDRYFPILSNSFFSDPSSIIWTNEEPIITPSEQSASNFASSLDFIPNPARVGTDAYFLTSSTFLFISSTFKFEEPVTPLKVM